MNYKIDKNLFILILFIINTISFSQKINNDHKFTNLIENIYYMNILNDEFIDISFDKFVFGNIDNNSNIYYKIKIDNDLEQIFFDFQSEYGCLYITIDEVELINSSYHYIFCSEGIDSIFTLNKNEIIEKIKDNQKSSISGLTFFIKVGLSNLELHHDNINCDFSLKVSAKKPKINILEINSEHKTLCEMEKVNENNYRCLFVITDYESKENIDKDNMIIYSTSQNKEIKLNIYIDYINKTLYDNYNIDYLNNSIPNINSTYTNNNTELNFINIQNLESNKYFYISVESSAKTTIEIVAQKIIPNKIKLPLNNNIQINKIDKNIINIYFNFNKSIEEDFSLSLVTLYGKASIYLGYDDSTEYITDTIENKLILNLNKNSCNLNESNCKLIIYNLEQNDYIFYISYKAKPMNSLNELMYGKSNKMLFTDFQFPILLYEKIPNMNSPININLQIYNIPEINLINDEYDVEILVLQKKELHQIKLNHSYIKYYDTMKKKFDSILSSINFFLSIRDIRYFGLFDDPFLIIYITNNSNNSTDNNILNKLILGSTISQINSLIYPSERIYHYGELNKEEKIVYKLKGKPEYHLMRLEFGSNSDLIEWTVKRTNDNDNYRENDTDLSFVTEKWINGRELLTMYIENGEDIYLTIFTKNIITNSNLTNYIFKYINSKKNDDFQNHLIKHNALNYDINTHQLGINKINIIPSNSKIVYYLKIINENDYIKDERINTIAIIESNSTSLLKENNDNQIFFNIENYIDRNNIYYINVYAVIIEKNYNIEYISFSGIVIEGKKIALKISKNGLILSSFIIGCCSFLILLISLIKYCVNKRKRRRYYYEDNDIFDNYLDNNDLFFDDILI